jgi:hypothetical protein
MKGVYDMTEEKLSGDDLKELMDYFVDDVILRKKKWVGMEMPPLHRLFPHNVREMFTLWYNLGRKEKVTLLLDINAFHHMFMEKLAANKIKRKLIELKSEFNRSYGSYKYKFNSLRLTSLGLYLYLNILPDIKNSNSGYSYSHIKAQRNSGSNSGHRAAV